VAGVATGIPAFLGYTQTGPAFTPTRISSLKEYELTFGFANPEAFSVSVVDVTTTTPDTRTITVTPPSFTKFVMYYSLQMYFANGGGPCWIVSVGSYASVANKDHFYHASNANGLAAIARVDEPTLLVFPDATVNFASSLSDFKVVVEAALTQCNTLQDRFTIMDVPGGSVADASSFRSTGIGMNNLKYGAAYLPYLDTVLNYSIDETQVITWTVNGIAPSPAPADYKISTIATFNPPLYRQILAEINKKYFVTLPPSGIMAGIYASVDRERGVWKAPANVSVSAVVGPDITITDAEQGDLNVDPTGGKSINVIRAFTGKGTLVWGARTLAGNDNEWRYVPVRRLFIYAEESIKKASEFVVFEANDKNTWLRMKSMISNFLTDLWRQGALVGAKADQAFFIHVGLGETMSAQDILEGKLIIRIGLAAVRPAEFIILEFQHKLQEA
jgi:phage tail sheath protein FI